MRVVSSFPLIEHHHNLTQRSKNCAVQFNCTTYILHWNLSSEKTRDVKDWGESKWEGLGESLSEPGIHLWGGKGEGG